jgi:hypothetical protein
MKPICCWLPVTSRTSEPRRCGVASVHRIEKITLFPPFFLTFRSCLWHTPRHDRRVAIPRTSDHAGRYCLHS